MTKEDGATIHRVRWYGKRNPKLNIQRLFVERKMHRSDWSGPMSIKDRAIVQQGSIAQFLNGSRQGVPEMLRRDASADMLNEVQDYIVEREQRPVLRSVYDRTAFQRANDCSIRVTIDENIKMVKEQREKLWRHIDNDNVDQVKFDYCILEIKLQKEAPAWVEQMVSQDIIVPAIDFSKYLHGVSMLYHKDVQELPYWVKPNISTVYSLDLQQMARRSSPCNSSYHSVNDILEMQDESIDKEQSACLIPASFESVVKQEEKVLNNDKQQPQLEQTITIVVQNQVLDSTPQDNQCQQYNSKKDNDAQSAKSKPPFSKRSRVVIRTRVEPKVFFANERTFLSWLSVSILLLFTALSLISQHQQIIVSEGILRRCQNSGHTEIQCEAGLISGIIMAPTGITVMVYALYLFRKRTFKILRRETLGYGDWIGPIVITFMLICVMLLSFMLSLIANL
eukprot:TRINITY_DN7237_c1_g1_i3.p1 TRINITY_DN7237_c1_g1~~TRINITY_DN7237_c1_g1_i3.p1  ORF type:complete len:478 (-),score=23.25 TRINITY_DN7237_c1_g1_i3:451-1803(-)